MQNNEQKTGLSQESLGRKMWIYSVCILLNTAAMTFLFVTRLIIIILWPFVQLSLLLEYLSLKLKHTILKENLKAMEEMETDSDS